jgi:hypothetical protein
MPWASQSSLGRKDAHFQRRAIVSAIRRSGVDLVLNLEKKHLPTLNTVNLHLLLFAVLQAEGRYSLELKLLCHGFDICAELCSLSGVDPQVCLELEEASQRWETA